MTKSTFPRYVVKRMRLLEKEQQYVESQAIEFLKDKAKVWDLLYKFRDWFTRYGDMAQCTLFQMKRNLDYSYAMDILADFDGPWNQIEKHALYIILKHHGSMTFSFNNLLELVENIQKGEVIVENLRIPQIRSDLVRVLIFTLGGSIPYNPLNMHMKLRDKTTIKQIVHLVKVSFGWPTRDIKLYGSQACEEVLQDDITLKQLLDHNNNGQLETIELYMDFAIGYVDNPLIFSDHYFEGRTTDELIEDL